MTPVDRLTALHERFRVRTRHFHTGPLCGVTTFASQPGRSFLHVLRRGEMSVEHQGPGGQLRRIRVDQPSLLFYPRPMQHAFHNAPTADSDFACATVEFDGGAMNPLVRTLPSVIVLPLDDVPSLAPSLDLLFAEIDSMGCGQPLVVDRLFEVVLIALFRWILDNVTELALPAGVLTGLCDPRIAPALLAVHELPGNPWTVESMAHEANMSRSAFAARFADRVGQSPAEYVTDWRLLIAQQRLRAGAPVGIVAAEVGYTDASAFSRVFSQRLGCSPRAWLALQEGEDPGGSS